MILVTTTLVALVVASITAKLLLGRSDRTPVAATNGPPASRHRGRWSILRRRRRPRSVRPAAVAAWADDLARSLRHGSTLHAALVHTLPTDDVVAHHSASLRHWLGRGATVADACDEWSDELADTGRIRASRRIRSGHRIKLLATMSAVLAAAAALGGAAAAPLDRFAVTMRQRSSDDLERRAQSAQAMMSAKVLTSVPVAVLALLLLTDADVRAVVASPAGGTVVALGLALNTVGAFWMQRIAGNGGRGTS